MVRFHNLYPEDVPLPITPALLEEQSGRWKVILGGSVWTVSGLYNFVRQDGKLYVCKALHEFCGQRVGHTDLANGEPVEYAGEIQFSGRKNRGLLRHWNNASGHYKPSPDVAGQADLPVDAFRPKPL